MKKLATLLLFLISFSGFSQIINSVTGRAWEPGDDLPNDQRDDRYLGPEENGTPPNNPARYQAPRQLLFGLSFRL